MPFLFALALVLVLPLGLPGAPILVGLILYLFGGLLAARALRRREGSRWWERPPVAARQWGWTLLVVPVLMFEASGLQLLLAGAWELSPGLAEGFLEFMTGLDSDGGAGWFGVEILLGVILAPVVEELLFRKLLLERWIRRMGTTKAILAQAALFGVFHLLFVGAFVFGLFAALLYLRTRTIWVPVAFHVLNNGMGWALWALIAPGVWYGSIPAIRDAAPAAALIAGASGAVLVWLAVRMWPRGAAPPPPGPP